jgi:hypothetical protein
VGAAALRALIRIARAIGRWIVEHLLEHGREMLIGYMVGKVGDFRRRLARAKRPRRKTWLTGRIRRWNAAIAWLRKNAAEVTRDAVKSACASSAALRGLPVVSPCEVEPR